MDSSGENDRARPGDGRAVVDKRPIAASDLALRITFWLLTIVAAAVVAVPYLTID